MKKKMWAVVGSVMALILIPTMGAVLPSAETGENTPKYAEAEGQHQYQRRDRSWLHNHKRDRLRQN